MYKIPVISGQVNETGTVAHSKKQAARAVADRDNTYALQTVETDGPQPALGDWKP